MCARPIKFRIWNGLYLEYIDDFYFFEESMMHENGDTGYEYESPLMQYFDTSLIDGKEIYEEDIVTDGFNRGIVKFGVYSFIPEEGALPWTLNGFYVDSDLFKPDINMTILLSERQLGVIGNTYEGEYKDKIIEKEHVQPKPLKFVFPVYDEEELVRLVLSNNIVFQKSEFFKDEFPDWLSDTFLITQLEQTLVGAGLRGTGEITPLDEVGMVVDERTMTVIENKQKHENVKLTIYY